MSKSAFQAMLSENLTRVELEKFERISADLLCVFMNCGEFAVPTCVASGNGEERLITFRHPARRRPMAVMSAVDFMSGTVQEISNLIRQQVQNT